MRRTIFEVLLAAVVLSMVAIQTATTMRLHANVEGIRDSFTFVASPSQRVEVQGSTVAIVETWTQGRTTATVRTVMGRDDHGLMVRYETAQQAAERHAKRVEQLREALGGND